MRQPVAADRLRWCSCRTSRRIPNRILRVLVAAVVLAAVTGTTIHAQQTSDKAMALYTDSANFQNANAFDLAIDGWKRFLANHSDDPMAPQAAHYLGVCYMQKEDPNLVAASTAFELALRNKEYKLREESLANHGWCLYASAADEQPPNKKRLQRAMDSYATLRKENPRSRFLDRALFYSGEAAFLMEQPVEAIKFYDQLLAMPGANKSPLRCDAFYARGVAHENLQQFDKAIASYQQLLGSCKTAELVTDVHLRIGDMSILRKQFPDAAKSFAAAFQSTASPEDRSYALFRQAYALVQSGRPGDAASKYDQLLAEFPDSPYTAAATLASAQSAYRGGDIDQAADRFHRVLSQNNAVAATEAAHWLARVEISKGNSSQARQICQRQIDAGAEGNFSMSLRLDLAETLSMDPKTIRESMVSYEQAYHDFPNDPLAPRALYNAAFSALQAGEPKKALELALVFITKFPADTLAADVRFVAAESQLKTGQLGNAANTYKHLLAKTGKDNIQRPLWVLRAATTYNAAKKFDDTVAMLRAEMPLLKKPAQVAEAQLLLGQAHLQAGRASDASKAFDKSRRADANWARSDEAFLMVGQSLLTAGDKKGAVAAWNKLIAANPTARMADQARYKLAQLASSDGDFREAVTHYDQILKSANDPALIPYSLYGKGWSLIQLGQFDTALLALDQMLRDGDPHAVRNDAVLARGITLRNLNRLDEAKADLERYLATMPSGTNLGHALYELALIDQNRKKPDVAAQRLERLVNEVPDYPSMDKVLYELGWSQRESGDENAAIKSFTALIQRYKKTPLAAEAAYFVGQKHYADGNWKRAAEQFRIAAENSDDGDLSEKANYRLGWSHFKSQEYESAERAFQDQTKLRSAGKLALDAMMMVGECRFKRRQYKEALGAFAVARKQIQKNDDRSQTVRDPAERQVRELVLLHGGQSAAQLKQWQAAIGWYAELKKRFPATSYLPQTFYETGFAYQQSGDNSKALAAFSEVAGHYRNEIAARARFMMGEIHFGQHHYDDAIREFQQVMFGFNADKAPESIKNWQAKSGYEAGRCGELLWQQAKTAKSREKAKKIANNFFNYVIQSHPQHELAAKSRERLEALKQQ